MGLFSAPKCPYCGSGLERTGYCAPHPAYRCQRCIKDHEVQELKKRIENIERAAKEAS